MDGSILFSTERRDVKLMNENFETFCQVEGERVEFFFHNSQTSKISEKLSRFYHEDIRNRGTIFRLFFQKYFAFYEFNFLFLRNYCSCS